jgi:hypothetical protein
VVRCGGCTHRAAGWLGAGKSTMCGGAPGRQGCWLAPTWCACSRLQRPAGRWRSPACRQWCGECTRGRQPATWSANGVARQHGARIRPVLAQLRALEATDARGATPEIFLPLACPGRPFMAARPAERGRGVKVPSSPSSSPSHPSQTMLYDV